MKTAIDLIVADPNIDPALRRVLGAANEAKRTQDALRIQCPFCAAPIGVPCKPGLVFPQYQHTVRYERILSSQQPDVSATACGVEKTVGGSQAAVNKYAHDDDGEAPPDRGWTRDQYGNRCRAP